MDEMTNQQLETILEMAIMIVENSKDKEEAVQKLKNLEIMKQKKNSTD